MLIELIIEIKENNIKPKNTIESGSKKAFFTSLILKIKGTTRNDTKLSMLIKKYCIAILSTKSNQYIYIEMVNKTK